MSESAPEGGRRGRGAGGGSFLTRKAAGMPVWAWGALGLVALGGIVYLIHERNKTAAATSGSSTGSGCTDANGQPVDCQSILAVKGGGSGSIAQYEQLTSQLTGLSGQDAAILEAIKDSQGHESRDHDRDHDHDHDGNGGGSCSGGKVKVPDVMGIDTDEAENIIKRAGLNPQVSGHDDGTVVAAEVPPANTCVVKGSTVVLAHKKGTSSRRHGGGGERNPGGGRKPPHRKPRPRVDNKGKA